MFIGLEQPIINKGFVYNNKSNNLLSFHKIDDKLSQINLQFKNNVYTFSFPINDIHYSTKFTNKKNLIKYMNYIIHTCKF